jgi:two-component system invasion response regulator UvrY
LIRVLIVDDHALVRMGIKHLLATATDIVVVGEAEDGETALNMVKQVDVDVLVLDLKLPGLDGLEVIRRLNRSLPKLPIIALSALSAEPLPSKVLQLGAMGFVSKESSLDEMPTAIRKVFRGEHYLSSELAQRMAMKAIAPKHNSPFEQLSDRETQVMLMITSGLTVPEIAKRLFLSTKTINCYRYRMFAKLAIKNDVELTHLALQHAVIEPQDES